MITNSLVAEDHERHNGLVECFYCKHPVGHTHAATCHIPSKRVRIRAVIEYERDVPAIWDDGLTEFSLNERSSCADNELDRIAEYAEQIGCLCAVAQFELLGNAQGMETRQGEDALAASGEA